MTSSLNRFLLNLLQSIGPKFQLLTKFHKNTTNSYRDIGFNSRTDRQRERQRDRGTDGQIIVSGVTERL